MQYCQVKTASLAVTGEPSDQSSPSLSFQVIVVKSADTPPFSTVGISCARSGARSPLVVARHGSITRLAACRSLVPPDRYGVMIEIACQSRTLSWPSDPRSAKAAEAQTRRRSRPTGYFSAS